MKINVMENRERRVNNLCKMLENIKTGLSQDNELQMMILSRERSVINKR